MPKKGISGAADRAQNPEGRGFERFFARMLMKGTDNCFERDILRAGKETLWHLWKVTAREFDAREEEMERQARREADVKEIESERDEVSDDLYPVSHRMAR